MNEADYPRLSVGDKVVRGPTWIWGDQDVDMVTGKPGVGVIISMDTTDCGFPYDVKWHNEQGTAEYRKGDIQLYIPVLQSLWWSPK